jgi:hypothetical protein
MGIEELRELVAELRDRFPAAAEAAARTCAALRDGGRPETGDLDLILRAVTDFDGAQIRLAEVRPEAPMPETLEALSQALDAAAAETSRSERLRRLVGIQGPAALEGILEQVRRAAWTDEPLGLELLVELIELAVDPSDFQELDEVAELARGRLPERWSPLISAALNRRLEIGEPDLRQALSGSVGTEAVPHLSRAAPNTHADERPDESADESTALAPLGAPPAGSSTIEAPIEAPVAETAAVVESTELSEPPSLTERIQPSEAELPVRIEPQAVEPGVAEAESAALRTARFGLAAWLRTAAGRPAAEAQARRCAALARDMSDFAGQLSAEFSATAEGLDARSLAADPAGGLLAWAAAIRAGIVHPTPESTRLLDDLALVVSPYPGLSAYGEAFARAADSGAYLVLGSSGDARGISQAGQNRQRAVRASVRLLEEGPHRKLKPVLVEETWRALVQQDAVLGRLLGAVARDEAARVDAIADQVAALRVGGAPARLIDETVRRVAGGPPERTITIWLGEMIGDALEVVARWVSAVKGTEAEVRGAGTDRLARALAELHGSIEGNEVLAATELSGPAAVGGPVVAAAAGAARLLIRETLELLDGAPTRTAEPPFAHAVNRELLLAPAVKIDPATLVPYEPPTLADLIPVALAAGEDWEAAFEARAAEGDHEGTRAIIAVLERREPRRVLPLRLRREELVRAARAVRDERVQTMRVRVAQGLRDGALAEDTALRIEGTLQDLTGPQRDDFGRVGRALDEVEADVARSTSHNLRLLGGTAGSSGAQF